jgi:hypothetical protein
MRIEDSWQWISLVFVKEVAFDYYKDGDVYFSVFDVYGWGNWK